MSVTADVLPSPERAALPDAAVRKLLELTEPMVRGLSPERRSFLLEDDEGPSAAP